MAEIETKTNAFVRKLLENAKIEFDEQKSQVKEIDNAFETASKSKTGKRGYPDFIAVVKDFILVIENKADLDKHCKFMENSVDKYNLGMKLGIDLQNVASVKDYAVNGAIHYAMHLIDNTNFKRVFCFGVSGDEKHHKITPFFVDDRKNLFYLDDIDSFVDFNDKNIEEYYIRNVLKEPTKNERELKEILKDAEELHEALRNYGTLKDQDKPLVVSGILLALSEMKYKNFSIDSLIGDDTKTDGEKIFDAIRDNLKRANVNPEVKLNKLLSQFAIIKDTAKINIIDKSLGKTPLKYYTEFLDERLFNSFIASHSAEDYLGRFYGEFMSYSGGDGQTLGIVLTPKHITELFCDLLDLQPTDKVFDPCCGTGGFLIAAMHKMLQLTDNQQEKINIRKNKLYGFELQPYMFSIATTNMILRGDGKSNLLNDDFLLQDTNELGKKAFTVGMMNPPYSQAKKGDVGKSEIAFIEHLLDSLCEGGRCAVIVPQSTMTGGNNKAQKQIKENILKNHTLEGVITLNKDTFYGVGVMPCIAIFTAHQSHPKDKICKFINFEDDGFKVAPHIGLIETPLAKNKKQHLLDVWFNRIEEQTKYCVYTTIEATDEWLHSFYYFNDEIPTEADFDKTISDYLSFEFSMIMQDREYLFEDNNSKKKLNNLENYNLTLDNKEWGEFNFIDIFVIKSGFYNKKPPLEKNGVIPFIGATDSNNGITEFYSLGNIVNNSKVGYGKNEPLEQKLFNGNCICVTNNGSVGYAYYQKVEFTCSHDVNPLYLKDYHLNEYIARFLISAIEKQRVCFQYSRKWRPIRMKKSKIKLPINSKGDPDYEFMENFIKERMEKKIYKYKQYIYKIANKNLLPLEQKKWGEFFITSKDINLLNLKASKSGIDKNKLTFYEELKDIPYITRTDLNNGLSMFVGKTQQEKYSIDEGNVITIGLDTQTVFYQPYNFFTGQNIQVLSSEKINKFSALFIVQLLKIQIKKFNWGGNGATLGRLARTKIVLPITSNGSPDYEYMENYSKNIMLKKYQKYMDFISKKYI